MSQSSLPSISELFSESWAFYKSAIKLFAPITLIMSAASILHGLLYLFPQASDMDFLQALLGIIGIVLGIWGFTATLYALRRYTEGDRTLAVRDIYRDCVPLIIPVTLTSILVGLMIIGGLILLIVPGIILAVWSFAALYIVVFEKINYWQAFLRSKELATGHWLDVGLRLLVIIVAGWIINLATIGMPLVQALLYALVVLPFCTYYNYLVYKALRDKQSLVVR
jgi:uncharacterized membrane protein